LIIPDADELELLPQALSFEAGADLPSSVDLRAKLPTVGDQGSLGSCTAWATAYAGATYSYALTTGEEVSSRSNQASPTYVYYRTLELQKSSCGSGTDIRKASDVLVTTGTPSLQELRYTDQCRASVPSAGGASRFKIGTYKLLGTDRNSVRA